MVSMCEKKVWQNFEIGNKKYMICVVKQNNKWNVFLTDLLEIWIESLTKENILQKCQTLNPLLSIDALDYIEIVMNMLNKVSEHVIEATVLEIKLRTDVEGIIFKFTLKLSKGSPQDFWENVTKPLCLASMELLHRQDVLLDSIKRKDEEIAEYKAEGAELIRKNIETKPFDESMFQTKSKINFADCTNAFQQMVQFCNTTNIQTMKVELDSDYTRLVNDTENASGEVPTTIKTEIDDTETSNTNGHASVKTKVECGVFVTQDNADQSSTNAMRKNIRDKVKPKRLQNIIKSTPIVIPSSKKKAKTLSDFIL